MILGSICDFSGEIFEIFGAMGPGSKFDGFSGLAGGNPELKEFTSGTLTPLLLEPLLNMT